MTEHWNEIPHRFGLFGVEGEVRPQYFVYQMLSRMGEIRVSAAADDPDLRVLAARSDGCLSAMIVNHNLHSSRDVLVSVHFANIAPGRKRLSIYRIDAERRWSPERIELIPAEQREVDVPERFKCQLYCPGDSVAMIALTDL
jgi:hypothetical protein